MKLKPSEIDSIIFDLDGVITSELAYWQSAALTVYELMFDHRYYGKQEIDRAWCHKQLSVIYDIIFCGGKTVSAVKKLGVNTNWDLAYVVFCVAKYLDPDLTTMDPSHFESVCMFIENIEMHPPELYTGLEGLLATVIPSETGALKRGESKFWSELLEVFQRWFHGDGDVDGLKESEQPLLPLAQVEETLKSLHQAGFRLGIGTGRPRDEAEHPLKNWGIDGYFEKDMCVTYDEVLKAQEVTGVDYPLAKPHPYVFLKAGFGDHFTDKELCAALVKKEEAKRYLVVGDAASDLLAAKAGGFSFAAVLTGANGQVGRSYFEETEVDLIFDSVLDLKAWAENYA